MQGEPDQSGEGGAAAVRSPLRDSAAEVGAAQLWVGLRAEAFRPGTLAPLTPSGPLPLSLTGGLSLGRPHLTPAHRNA